MRKRTRWLLTVAATASLTVGAAAQAREKPADELAELRAEIAGMRAQDVPWRRIDWKPCLIDGLRASREQHKPVLLWVFIDRPVDDARC